MYLARGVSNIEAFELVSDGSDLPVFAWKLKDGHAKNWNLYHLSDRLRMRGWQVPAYPLPSDMEEITVQRIVVRNGLSLDLAQQLMAEIVAETAYLEALTAPMPEEGPVPGFHH